jgi:hypothetical protein
MSFMKSFRMRMYSVRACPRRALLLKSQMQSEPAIAVKLKIY